MGPILPRPLQRVNQAAAVARNVPIAARREGRLGPVMDEDSRLAEVAARLRTAFDLFETGLEMRRQQLRRAHPGLADSEIEALVTSWLRERPGAELGDAVGRPIALGPSPE
jgi:hypothetical protein